MDVFGRFCNGPTEIHRLFQSSIITYLVFNKIGVLYYTPYYIKLITGLLKSTVILPLRGTSE
jgi:hypothetical protein